MNQKDLIKTTSETTPQREPTLTEKIDAVLDRTFAAPWIDRDRLRRELLEICDKANG